MACGTWFQCTRVVESACRSWSHAWPVCRRESGQDSWRNPTVIHLIHVLDCTVVTVTSAGRPVLRSVLAFTHRWQVLKVVHRLFITAQCHLHPSLNSFKSSTLDFFCLFCFVSVSPAIGREPGRGHGCFVNQLEHYLHGRLIPQKSGYAVTPVLTNPAPSLQRRSWILLPSPRLAYGIIGLKRVRSINDSYLRIWGQQIHRQISEGIGGKATNEQHMTLYIILSKLKW